MYEKRSSINQKPQPNSKALSWEFHLRMKLSVVRFQAPTFDPGLVKNIIKSPNSQQNRACYASKKDVLALTEALKK